MTAPKQLPPMKLLRHDYPDAFESLDDVREEPRYGSLWPHNLAWVTSDAVLGYMVRRRGCAAADLPYEDAERLPALLAVSGWRQAKMVYDFSPALTEALYRQGEEGHLAVGTALLQLPCWAAYIRPNYRDSGDENDKGYDSFVCRDFDKAPVLRFLSVTKTGKPDLEFVLYLRDEEETFEEAICHTAERLAERWKKAGSLAAVQESLGGMTFDEESLQETVRFFGKVIRKWLMLVLYLSAGNAEIRRDPSHFFRRTRKVADIPREVESFLVGEKTGLRLMTLRRRAAASSEEKSSGGHHRSPLAHLRRAHWHTYYMGPRKGGAERKRVLKWIAPILVGTGGNPLDMVTMAKVKK